MSRHRPTPGALLASKTQAELQFLFASSADLDGMQPAQTFVV